MTLKAEYFLAGDEKRTEDQKAIAQLQSSTGVRPEAIMVVPTRDQVLEAFERDEIATKLYFDAGPGVAGGEIRPLLGSLWAVAKSTGNGKWE